jgi:hypothetical protein
MGGLGECLSVDHHRFAGKAGGGSLNVAFLFFYLNKLSE